MESTGIGHGMVWNLNNKFAKAEHFDVSFSVHIP